MKNLLLIILFFTLFLKTSYSQFKDYSFKYGLQGHLLSPSTEFDTDAYRLSLLGRGFLRFEINTFLEGEIGVSIGELNGKDFNNKNWSTQIFPTDLRIIFSPFRLNDANPYLYSGLGMVRWNISKLPSVTSIKKSKEIGWNSSIPIGGGIEITVAKNTLLDISGGYTFTSTDDLNFFNNPKVNDGYFNFGFGLTFVMGSENNDEDNDGLSTKMEYDIGTNPKNADSDGDKLTDGEEVSFRSNPLSKDTDSDALDDYEEIKVYKTDPISRDSDGDDISDYDEVIKYHTNPNNKDSDDDGISDGYELNIYKTNPKIKDSDKDRLNDKQEIFEYKTDPNNYDSDGDGLSDGDEILRTKTNPLVADNPIKFENTNDTIVNSTKSIVLRGIVFESDKADLSQISEKELLITLRKMENDPNLKIEVRGYTDNTGSSEYNIELSQKRADAVRLWLVKRGIDAMRIKAIGLGESNPIADNKTEEGKILNRRIEIIEFNNQN